MFFKDFIKNPQTTIALTFLAHIISGIDGVASLIQPLMYNDSFIVSEYCLKLVYLGLRQAKSNMQWYMWYCALWGHALRSINCTWSSGNQKHLSGFETTGRKLEISTSKAYYFEANEDIIIFKFGCRYITKHPISNIFQLILLEGGSI